MILKSVVDLFTSLRLTVVCLSLAMVLVFAGTLAQVKLGLYAAQEGYFQSFLIFWGPPNAGWKIPVFPGGYLLGSILLLNLISAHLKRFKFTRKKIGIFMTHAGLILLLLGQLFTEMLSEESAMRISEGQSANYSQSFRNNEFVVIDTSDPQKDRVVALPEMLLEKKRQVAVPSTPLTIRLLQYWPNSELTNAPVAGAIASGVTNGVGEGLFVLPMSEATRTDDRNMPTAVVEVQTAQGSLGHWLLSSRIGRRQKVIADGKSYDLSLRFTRHYKPFSLHLIDFKHDKYSGTEIPKNFSSLVRLDNPQTQEQREVNIYMNNPLRYGGETYYQGSFDPTDDRVTILQVVHNPSWLTPYIACILVGLGLVVQFMMHLVGFISKRRLA